MTVRERTQGIERQILSPYAAFSDQTKGRKRPEEDDDLRTPFQRDRDRIIHCKSFRRLKHKTQVFLAPEGDHYRTRLTHTLEVAQIARTIARALCLNEDLTEAIALGHDLGHTPFGHAGERALNELCPEGFRHYEQSARVVERVEKNGEGLNLTEEVVDGILCHTTGKQAETLEGQIVRVSDRIAYINHDIDDSERAGIIREEDLPQTLTDLLGHSKSQRINTLVCSVVESSQHGKIEMEPEIEAPFDELRRFMLHSVYENPYAKSEEKKVPGIIGKLYEYFGEPGNLPDDMRRIEMEDGLSRAVTDYIAGMTDQYAVEKFMEIYVPKAWNR